MVQSILQSSFILRDPLASCSPEESHRLLQPLHRMVIVFLLIGHLCKHPGYYESLLFDKLNGICLRFTANRSKGGQASAPSPSSCTELGTYVSLLCSISLLDLQIWFGLSPNQIRLSPPGINISTTSPSFKVVMLGFKLNIP